MNEPGISSSPGQSIGMKADALVAQVVEDVTEQPGIAVDEHGAGFILMKNTFQITFANLTYFGSKNNFF